MPAGYQIIERTIEDLATVFNEWSHFRRAPLHELALNVFGKNATRPSEQMARLVADTIQSHNHARLNTHLSLAEKLTRLAMGTQIDSSNLVPSIFVLTEADTNMHDAVTIFGDIAGIVIPNKPEIRERIIATRANLDTALDVMDGKQPRTEIGDLYGLKNDIAALYRDAAKTVTEEVRVQLAYLGALDMHRDTRQSATDMLAIRTGRASVARDIERVRAMLRLSKSLGVIGSAP